MAYTQILGTDNIGSSLTTINSNNNAFDTRITSLETTRTTINNSIATLTNLTNSSNYVLQQVVTIVTAGNITSTNSFMRNTIDDTGLSPISITRKDNQSNLLFELVGGNYKLSTGKTMQTFFYISLNNGPFFSYNGNQPAEYITRTGGGFHQGPHLCRGFYIVNNPSITDISLAVFASFNDANQSWNTVLPVSTPLTLSITEIK